MTNPIIIDLAKCKCPSTSMIPPWPCVRDCPLDCIKADTQKNIPVVVYPDECGFCGNCRISCPHGAIQIKLPLSMIV